MDQNYNTVKDLPGCKVYEIPSAIVPYITATLTGSGFEVTDPTDTEGMVRIPGSQHRHIKSNGTWYGSRIDSHEGKPVAKFTISKGDPDLLALDDRLGQLLQ